MNDCETPSTRSDSKPATRKSFWMRALGVAKIAAVTVVVAGAFYLLYREFRDVQFEEVMAGFNEIRAWKIGLAVILTSVYYLVLTGYDLIALRYMRKRIGLFKVMIGAIVGYAVSHQFGWILGGTAARYYLYSNWGLRGWEIVKFIAILSLTYWLGLFVMAGVAFTAFPMSIPDIPLGEQGQVWSPRSFGLSDTRPLGIAFLLAGVAYLGATVVWRKPIVWGRQTIELPSLRLSVLQITVSAADFALAALVFYVLLPPSMHARFTNVLCGYLLAQIVVALLHVPGGWGVFEAVMAAAIGMEPGQKGHLLSVFVVYRVVYFALPLVAGLSLIGWNELVKMQAAAKNIQELNDPEDAPEGPDSPPAS